MGIGWWKVYICTKHSKNIVDVSQSSIMWRLNKDKHCNIFTLVLFDKILASGYFLNNQTGNTCALYVLRSPPSSSWTSYPCRTFLPCTQSTSWKLLAFFPHTLELWCGCSFGYKSWFSNSKQYPWSLLYRFLLFLSSPAQAGIMKFSGGVVTFKLSRFLLRYPSGISWAWVISTGVNNQEVEIGTNNILKSLSQLSLSFIGITRSSILMESNRSSPN